MNRGAGWLTVGMLLVIVSLCGGSMIQQAAVESFKRTRGPDEAFETVNRLSPWAGVVNLAFYGGIVAVIVGIVLLIIDGSRPSAMPSPPAHPPIPSSVEEENRRLREELDRIRREKSGESG